VRDPDVARFAYRRTFAEADVRELLGPVQDQRMADGTGAIFAIRAGDEFLGIVMLFLADWEERKAELGFWLAAAARGRGAGTRAVRLLFDWAVEQGLERVQALCHVENEGAHAVLERAGFTREGVLRGLEAGPDGRVDQVSYARLSTD
jgi:RimJ/RimL family protein N-acetyltransferase